MKTAKRIAVVLTCALSFGLVGAATATPAQADTSWGCGGWCI